LRWPDETVSLDRQQALQSSEKQNASSKIILATDTASTHWHSCLLLT